MYNMEELDLETEKKVSPKKDTPQVETVSIEEKVANNSTTGTAKVINNTMQKDDRYKTVKDIKIITAVCETLLAIPFLWATIILSMVWIPLFVMFILHLWLWIYISKNPQLKIPAKWNIIWTFISLLAIIPFVWMILHIITAIILWLEVDEISKAEK